MQPAVFGEELASISVKLMVAEALAAPLQFFRPRETCVLSLSAPCLFAWMFDSIRKDCGP